jgi:ABC-type sugar transport system permease subunit
LQARRRYPPIGDPLKKVTRGMATQFARPVEKNNVAAYAFLAPALLFFLLFQVLPIIGTLLLSIHSGGILSGFKFNGFSNYSEVFHSREILQCLEFTVTYVVLIIPTVIGFSLFIAVLLTDRFLGARNFFKTLVFFPGLAPMVTLATLWRFMIDPDIGLLNIIMACAPFFCLSCHHLDRTLAGNRLLSHHFYGRSARNPRRTL